MSEGIKDETQIALLWADRFIEHKKNNDWSLEDIDEGLMLSWFANFAEKVKDQENNNLKAELERLKGIKEVTLKENYTLTCMNDSLNSDLSLAVDGLEEAKEWITFNSHKADCKLVLLRLTDLLKKLKPKDKEVGDEVS